MLSIKRPVNVEVESFLRRQVDQPFSYDWVGCTRQPPAARRGWNTDRSRVLLGQGGEVFARACQAIDSWQMFPPEIAQVFGRDRPRENLVVVVLYCARFLPLWLLMPARIVCMIDETISRDGQTIERYGFAYGTLPDHPERGEERFLIEWNRLDDSVHYDLLAISQPRHVLARLAYPFTRWEQARFRRLSGRAMRGLVE